MILPEPLPAGAKPFWRRRGGWLIFAGYVLAWIAACVALDIRVALEVGPQYDASSGMYAFGDMLFFLFAFAVASVPATVLALLLARKSPKVWPWLANGALLAAGCGVASALVYAFGRGAPPPQLAFGLALYVAIMHLLLSPLIAGGLFLVALFAPSSGPRARLLIASAIESIVAVGSWLWWSGIATGN